jgi:hypothetical protein
LRQNTPLPVPPSALPNLTYRHGLLENSPDMRSSQWITPDPFLPLHYDPVSSSFSPQIVTPVNDEGRLCAIYSVSTPPLPPMPAPQTTPFYPSHWRKIPQNVYEHGKKQWDFQPSEPVLFYVNGCPGINMGDALRKKPTGLDGRDDLVLQDAQDTVSCRYWVGFSCQVPSRTRVDRLVNSSLGTRSIVRLR